MLEYLMLGSLTILACQPNPMSLQKINRWTMSTFLLKRKHTYWTILVFDASDISKRLFWKDKCFNILYAFYTLNHTDYLSSLKIVSTILAKIINTKKMFWHLFRSTRTFHTSAAKNVPPDFFAKSTVQQPLPPFAKM